MRRLPTAALLLAALACGPPRPVDIGVTFGNTWRIRGQTLTADEQARIKRTALATLRGALSDFDVHVAEDGPAARTIKIEDTPYGRMLNFGASGMTYPVSMVSIVRFDILANNVLAAAGCETLDGCAASTRGELVEGLGRGIGATAAHELGHQAGLGFSHDARCDDCYDGDTSTSYAHFFGAKHWSDGARAQMRRTLPIKNN
jgi:hypothetical protein